MLIQVCIAMNHQRQTGKYVDVPSIYLVVNSDQK